MIEASQVGYPQCRGDHGSQNDRLTDFKHHWFGIRFISNPVRPVICILGYGGLSPIMSWQNLFGIDEFGCRNAVVDTHRKQIADR